MKLSPLSLAGAVVPLVVADALAFHDPFEPHTIRDWLMLVATGLAVVGLVAGLRNAAVGPVRRSG